jgi:hypothetical protein
VTNIVYKRGGTYSRTVDGTAGVSFPPGNGSQLDDMARIVLLEVCAGWSRVSDTKATINAGDLRRTKIWVYRG